MDNHLKKSLKKKDYIFNTINNENQKLDKEIIKNYRNLLKNIMKK